MTVTWPVSHVSYSSLTTYQTCPRKWAWHYLRGYRGPTNASLWVGQVVHKALAVVLQEQGSLAETLPRVAEEWMELAPPPDRDAVQELLDKVPIEQIQNVIADILNRHIVNYVEETIRRVWSDRYPPLVGVVDAMLTNKATGEVVMIDWKTTQRSPGSTMRPHHLEQLTAYAYLVNSPLTARVVYIVMTKSPKVIQFETSITRAMLERYEREVLQGISAIIESSLERARSLEDALLAFPQNPTTPLCSERWCPYYPICFQGKTPEEVFGGYDE